MDKIEIKKILIKLIEEKHQILYQKNFTEVTNFFKEGIVDSIEHFDLLVKIERTFNLKFSSEEISSDAFDTLQDMSNFVSNKLQENINTE
ncbi:MAG: acyl carrier protein [Candidatus Aquirickettsiella sp.]